MAPSNLHDFVILGGNFGGLGTAHTLLKHTIPALKKVHPSTSYHVTMVAPNTHFFYKICAPRTLAGPNLIPWEKAFYPIAENFKKYPSSSYTFIEGKAIGLDPATKTVTVETASKSTTQVQYSTLIIATGTTSNSALWTLNGSHENSIREMQGMHAALPKAKTILLAGGGPAGTETVGEIASRYRKAQITHLSGGSRLLSRLLPATSKAAEDKLKALGVSVVHNLQVRSATKLPSGKTELVLSDGSTRSVDVYIDSTGGSPNTSFLPASWLNERNQILTDPKTIRVTAPGADGIYAVGDAASYSNGGVMDANDAVAPMCSSIAIDLGARDVKQKIFKPLENSQFVPTGPKGGVGQIMGHRIPSFMVWAFKSRDFMVWMAPPVVNGNKWS